MFKLTTDAELMLDHFYTPDIEYETAHDAWTVAYYLHGNYLANPKSGATADSHMMYDLETEGSYLCRDFTTYTVSKVD